MVELLQNCQRETGTAEVEHIVPVPLKELEAKEDVIVGIDTLRPLMHLISKQLKHVADQGDQNILLGIVIPVKRCSRNARAPHKLGYSDI